MKFSIKDFFSKCDQIRSFLEIWSHILKKSLMENFIFCAVLYLNRFHTLVNDVYYEWLTTKICLILDFGFSNSKYHRYCREITKETKFCISSTIWVVGEYSFPVPVIITIFDKTQVKNHDLF